MPDNKIIYAGDLLQAIRDDHSINGANFAKVRRHIEAAKAVDAVEVVHGEWLDGCAIHNGKEVYKSIDCSVCEEIFKIESHDREYWKERFKVCPFCGADMRGEKDGK